MLATMKLRNALVALSAACLLLTGCSGATQESSEPTAETPAVVEEASTVSQWASLIARQKASWDEWQTTWDEMSCSGVMAGSAAGGTCRLQLMSAMYQTQTTTIEYELATSPGKKGFIAEQPHSEIASLFAATQDAAKVARDASAAWDEAGCSLTGEGDCGALAVSFDRAIDDLSSQFAAWGPYI